MLKRDILTVVKDILPLPKLTRFNVAHFSLFAILALGLALRLYLLDSKSLWLDEAFSVELSKKTQTLPSIVWGDWGNPPVYHIILHLFLHLGNNENVARLPSVIFGMASIFLIYKVGKLFFTRKEGLLSALLLSISAMHVRFSQEARMYSLVTMLALLSILFFHLALKENDIKLWIGLMISTLLGVLTHYYMLFILLIEASFLFMMLVKNKESLIIGMKKIMQKRILILIFASIVTFAFLYPLFRYVFFLLVAGKGFIVGNLKASSFFEILFGNFTTGGFIYEDLPEPLLALLYLYIPVGLFLFGAFSSIRKKSEPIILLLLWVLLPTVTLFVLALSLGRPVGTAKYLIFVLPSYLVGISRGIIAIDNIIIERFDSFSISISEKNKIGFTLLLAILIFGGMSIFPLGIYYEAENENWRSAAEYLKTHAKHGEIIIVEPNYALIPFLYYYPDSNGNTVLSTNGSIDNLLYISSKNLGLWFVQSSHIKHVDREGRIANWLDQNLKPVKTVASVTIYYRPMKLVSNLTLTIFPTTVSLNESVSLKGQLEPAIRTRIDLYCKLKQDITWNLTAILATNATGFYSWAITIPLDTPRGTYEFVAYWSGNQNYSSSKSSIETLVIL